jgi:RHS repeat-associated protein
MRYFVMKCIFLLSFFYFCVISHTANAYEIKFSGSNERQLHGQLNTDHGEKIDVVRGELSYETIDAIIPGNKGMDIVISRTYGTSERVWGFDGSYGDMVNWHFEIPRIIIPTMPWGFTQGWQPTQFDSRFSSSTSRRTGICNDPYPGEGQAYQNDSNFPDGIAERFWRGMQLKIPGQPVQYLLLNTDTSGRYPDDAKWVTTSDWVASCSTDGNAFIVKSPQGITYTMDILMANYNFNGVVHGYGSGKNTLFTSQVADLHGSVISYSYENSSKKLVEVRKHNGRLVTNFLLPNDYNRLTQISRNDPGGAQTVEFDFSKEEYYGWDSIDGITVNGRTWTYDYALDSHTGEIERYLEKVTRPDGRFWEYKYEGEMSYRSENPNLVSRYWGPNRLTQVKLPSGGTIDYDYKVFDKLPNDPYNENMKLHTKTVNDGTTDIDHWVFDYKNNTGNTIKVTIDRGMDSEIQVYKNDKSYQHGRMLSRTVNRTNSGESKLTEYSYAELAEIGSFTFEDYPKNLAKSLTSKVKLTQQKVTQDSSNYITDILTHDLYGRPTKIKESHGSKYKYTKIKYHDEFENWLMGLSAKVEVSDTDANYSTVSEIIYHDEITATGVYKGLGLPYEQKSYGRWVKRFTEYSSEGNLQKVEYNVPRTVGAGNRFIKYTNYKRGIPQTTTTPSLIGTGSVNQTQVVDNNGWITSVTDLNNVTTTYSYDDLGRGQSIDLANDTTKNINWEDTFVTWGENTSGKPTRTSQRCVLNTEGSACLGAVKFSQVETYDGLLRLIKLSETDGATTRYKNFKYNRYNQKNFDSHWSDSDSELKGVTRVFDGLKRLESVLTSGLGTVEYDYLSGNRIKVTDAEDNITTTTYLAYGTPTYDQAIKVESPENVTTTIGIGVLGLTNTITQSGFQKDSVKIASQTETRLYDTYKHLCLIKRNDVGNTLFNKNALGETNWMAEGVSNTACTTTKPTTTAITYTLDNTGNVKAINYPDSESADVSYLHDNNGNLKTLTAGAVVHSYNYNNQNLLEDESFTIGSEKTLGVDYSYTSMMHRNYIAYPDGTTVFNKPNAFGQPTEVKAYNNDTLVNEFASNVQHYLSGQLDSFTYGNGITHKTTLDAISLLPSDIQDLDGSSPIIDLAYTYDNNVNIKSITDTENPNYTLSNLTYDSLDRLTSTTGNSGIGSSVINYDSLGNITYYSSKNSALDYTYNYGNNRLSSVSGTGSQSKSYSSFSYDKRGNITNNSHDELDFNHANQLYSSGTNSYLYDGFNRRVKHTDDNGTSYSLYGQDGTLLYRETDVSNGVGNGINYIYLGKKLIAKVVGNEPSANSRQHNKPYGKTTEIAKDDIGYAGHKYDTDLNLSYMQARYYDPVIGRFYSNDPVGFTNIHTFNRYAYANNNPYKYVDPDGREVKLQWHEVTLAGYNSGKNHSLLTITPNNPNHFNNYKRITQIGKLTNSSGQKYSTMGAGPNGSWDLESNYNRSTDAEAHTGGLVISPPNGMSEEAFVDSLIKLDGNYQDNKEYSFNPNGTDTFNSNSYVSGLLNASGFDTSKLSVPNAQGFDKPLPIEAFAMGKK